MSRLYMRECAATRENAPRFLGIHQFTPSPCKLRWQAIQDGLPARREASSLMDVFGMFSFTEVSPPLQKALTDPLILIGTFSYLLLAPLLRRSPLVDTRKGAYKHCMIAYNTLMAVYSLGCFLVTTTALGWDYGYGGWLRALTGDKVVELYTNTCPSPVWESTLFVWAAKSFYYSKYVEYLDTAWLVLKGKPVSFLQTFHHFGAPWDVYLGLALKNEGLWIFMFLNAFIHTLMYTCAAPPPFAATAHRHRPLPPHAARRTLAPTPPTPPTPPSTVHG